MMNLLQEINLARSENGLPELCEDTCLSSQAQNHALRMSKRRKMSHYGFYSRLSSCNKQSGSENVAVGQKTAKQCVKAWLNSMGHYKNMMGNWYVCGFGYHNGYWCAIFSN